MIRKILTHINFMSFTTDQKIPSSWKITHLRPEGKSFQKIQFINAKFIKFCALKTFSEIKHAKPIFARYWNAHYFKHYKFLESQIQDVNRPVIMKLRTYFVCIFYFSLIFSNMFIYIGMQFMYLGYCKSNVNNNFESSCKHFHYNLRNQPTNISLLFFIQIPLHEVSQKVISYIIKR